MTAQNVKDAALLGFCLFAPLAVIAGHIDQADIARSYGFIAAIAAIAFAGACARIAGARA